MQTNQLTANDSAALDDAIATTINSLIQESDPRLVLNALLGNAAALAELIVKAGKGTPANVAHAFGSALVSALTPTVEEAPRIEVVSAGVLPRR